MFNVLPYTCCQHLQMPEKVNSSCITHGVIVMFKFIVLKSALQSTYKDILYNETNISNFRKKYPVRLNALTFPKMLFITKGKTLHSHANHSHSSSVAFIYCFCLVCVVTFLLAQSYLFMLIIDANIRLIGMHVTQVITLLWFQYHHSSHSP